MDNDKITNEVKVIQYNRNGYKQITDVLIDDIWLEIYINDRLEKKILTVNRNLRELASGYLYCSLPIFKSEIAGNLIISKNKAYFTIDKEKIKSHSGLLTYHCALDTNPVSNIEKIYLKNRETHLTPENIFKILNTFEESSDIFKGTAGVHGAGLFTEEGKKIVFFTDIARYNCIKKILGFLIINDTKKIKDYVLMLSCRVNAEILEIAKRAGITIVLTRATVSNQAYNEARVSGITLIGFLREKRFTIFYDKNRIK